MFMHAWRQLKFYSHAGKEGSNKSGTRLIDAYSLILLHFNKYQFMKPIAYDVMRV